VKAEKAFRDALRKVDYEPQYYLNLAIALVRQVTLPDETRREVAEKRDQHIEEAKQACREALRLDPYNAKAYGYLGVIAYREEEFLEAEDYFRKSIDLNPFEGSRVELASLHCQMGRYKEATEQLEKALLDHPNDARIYIELASVADMTDDKKEAIALCRRAVFVEPRNPETHRALAVALIRDEQYDEAESVLRKALITFAAVKPWRSHLLLAQVLVRRGDAANKDRKKKELDLYEEALSHINDARQQCGAANADICFHAGIVQYKLEDYSISERNFVECVRLNQERFDAERYGRIVQMALEQQRRVFTLSQRSGIGLTIFCAVMLFTLWILYFIGHQRTVPLELPANTNSTATATATPQPMKAEATVDRALLNLMTPILLGLGTVGLLLPNLTKLKLPGFEAEVSEPKPSDPAISSGPRGDIKFGSPLLIVDPEPS
jgi:tetratricopeptide (TPR) repeat protein